MKDDEAFAEAKDVLRKMEVAFDAAGVKFNKFTVVTILHYILLQMPDVGVTKDQVRSIVESTMNQWDTKAPS